MSSDFDKLHYAADLYGSAFEFDNRKAWALLKQAVVTTKLWNYIRHFDKRSDARAGFLELDRVFLGSDFITKRLQLCYLVLEIGHTSSLTYAGETVGFSFLAYSGQLVKTYSYIAQHRNAIDERQQTLRLIAGITGDAKNRLTYAIERVKESYNDDMKAAISFLSSKVNDAYGEFNAKRNSGRNGQRKIQQAGRGGRGGRNGGRGHGRGHGRGRGNDDARYNGQTEVKSINGVDTSDAVIHQNFPPKVFHGNLRTYAFNRRDHLKGAGDKRKIQELNTKIQSLEDSVKKLKSTEDVKVEPNSEKGGQAGATFGKGARR